MCIIEYEDGNMKISIVVPVYNTGSYLRECLDSLVNQTFKDIEIICVNDCSTDNSLEILQEYAGKDKRVKIINHEKNKGQAAARNSGIEKAKGNYIAFIDSDDKVDLNFFEKLYKGITKNNADISAATILRTYGNYQKVRVKFDEEKTYYSLKDIVAICNIPKCCYVWNKLYKANIVKKIPFKEGVYFEDILWTLQIIAQAKSLTTVTGTNYYYRANNNSTVKKAQSKKKQEDSYLAKKFMIDFFTKNNLFLSDKNKTIVKSQKYLGRIPILKIKEFNDTEIYCLLGFLPFYRKTIKAPVIKDNTFVVWEPCSKSHSEVVPGYCKYLLDLGYHVSVLVTPDRYKEGLFSRFEEKNISYNKLTQREIKEYFKHNNIDRVKGVMVTTVGKICDCIHYNQAYSAFYPETDRKKLFFVEHEASFAVDKKSWQENLITLRKLNYKGAKSVVINPHYFGKIDITPKNRDITNFITIGAIRPNKKNSQMIVDAVQKIYDQGYKNFKVTVVGKGSIKHIPREIRQYFDVKGRLSFKRMYEEIEKADFMLTSYNEDDPEHIRYNTSGTSGNFQLMYGFLKPCIITEGFASINGLNKHNAILYKGDENYSNALIEGINMSAEDYTKMQGKLEEYEQKLYKESLENLKKLINNNQGMSDK